MGNTRFGLKSLTLPQSECHLDCRGSGSRIHISIKDPDPGELFHYGSTYIRIRRTSFIAPKLEKISLILIPRLSFELFSYLSPNPKSLIDTDQCESVFDTPKKSGRSNNFGCYKRPMILTFVPSHYKNQE